MPSISVRWARRGRSSSRLVEAPRLAISWAISMLPIAERVGKRLKRWKMKPILARRVRVRSASVRVAKSTPSIRTEPVVAPVSPPRM